METDAKISKEMSWAMAKFAGVEIKDIYLWAEHIRKYNQMKINIAILAMAFIVLCVMILMAGIAVQVIG